MINSTENSTTEPEFDAEAFRRADAAARATNCGIPGCEGTGHDVGDPAEWSHDLSRSSFDTATSVRVIKYGSESPVAYLQLAGADEMTAAELRVEADLYEAYPAFLRARADELEALTVNAKVNS
jgi:hypothetical protein